MKGPRVHGALLTLLLAGPNCGGRTPLEQSSPAEAMSTGGQGTPSPGGASGSHSSGASNSATGGTATSGGSSACRVETVLSRRPPVLEFLVDSSLSMKTALTLQLSRWTALQLGLRQTFSTLDENTLSGLIFYPNVQLSAGSHEGDTWCFLRLQAATIAPLAPVQRRLLLDALAAKAPLGATPTHDAYLYALEQLKAASDPGRAHLVLLTDSAPTYGASCSGTGITPVDTTPLEAAVREALDDGVHTFVIGLGSQDSAPWMSRLAVAGGTAPPVCSLSEPPFCHYLVGSVLDPLGALQNALLDVSARTSSCVYELPSEVAARELDSRTAALSLDAASSVTPLFQEPSAAGCEFGFVHAGPSSLTVELCSSTCQAAIKAPGARISLSRPCRASP